MFGATANIKQYYYEDITSANTLQNSNSTDLTSFLIDTALTAALQTCDLVITVVGSQNRISNIYKVEAERIVAVYHQYRKLIKTAAAEAESPLRQLKKNCRSSRKWASSPKRNSMKRKPSSSRKYDTFRRGPYLYGTRGVIFPA